MVNKTLIIKNDKNTQAMNDSGKNGNLKSIKIDGSNVAREHGNTRYGRSIFSCIGIKIAVDYFIKRGHSEIKVVVPRFRQSKRDKKCPTEKPEILDELYKKGYLIFSPSQSYDDRFIVEAAICLTSN